MTDAHTVVSLPVPREWLLTSNQRLSWRARANRTSFLRDAAGWHARGWLAQHRRDLTLPFARKVEATAWLRFPTVRDRDPANWYPTVKAIVDGVVDAGVLADDSSRYLVGPDMREAELKCPKGVAVHVLLVLKLA